MSELRSLRSDIDHLNDRVVRLRLQDFKDVFVEQVRLALGQEGRRTFESDIERMRGRSECELKPICMVKLQGAMDEVMSRLDKGDVEGASRVLEATEEQLRGDAPPCLDDSCSSSAMETVQKAKLVLAIYMGLKERLQASVGEASRLGEGGEEETAEGIEAALSPLSSSWRLRILRMLRQDDRSLSEMSKALGMRTGHMQFHIKSLREAGYIVSDRRTRTYSITEKGARALNGAERLVAEL